MATPTLAPNDVLHGPYGRHKDPSDSDTPCESEEHAHKLAAGIGFELIGVATGGGSDGNFTAPYAATLDGLGVDGKGAHTDFEQINISTIAPRAELLRQLLATLE